MTQTLVKEKLMKSIFVTVWGAKKWLILAVSIVYLVMKINDFHILIQNGLRVGALVEFLECLFLAFGIYGYCRFFLGLKSPSNLSERRSETIQVRNYLRRDRLIMVSSLILISDYFGIPIDELAIVKNISETIGSDIIFFLLGIYLIYSFFIFMITGGKLMSLQSSAASNNNSKRSEDIHGLSAVEFESWLAVAITGTAMHIIYSMLITLSL